MTVYVTQEPRPKKDKNGKVIWLPTFDTAAKYGPVKFVFSMDYNPLFNPKESVQHAKLVLSSFDPEVDFLIETPGTTPGASRACHCAIYSKGIDDINYLNFHKQFINGKRIREQAEYLPQRWSCNY